mmetsp:Transcript_45157/g.75155  ORF Transcript_45157/g.75155 Transcript_45157/m.75155 type:complete len:88 (-) Transcript_45157:64-327(-)
MVRFLAAPLTASHLRLSLPGRHKEARAHEEHHNPLIVLPPHRRELHHNSRGLYHSADKDTRLALVEDGCCSRSLPVMPGDSFPLLHV